MNTWQQYNDKPDNGKFLIKFMSEKNLFRFFKNGQLWFSRADQFGDKMECVTINDLKAKHFPFAKLIERKHKHLISCWHNVGRESISMWDASYESLSDRRVYAIKFKTDELIKLIQPATFATDIENLIRENLFGRVVYKNLLKDRNELDIDKMKRVAFRKEYSFSYEQEFRFVVRGNKVFKDKGYGLDMGDPMTLDYSIMVNPLLLKEDYIAYLNKLLAHPVGNEKYQDSELVGWLKPLEW